MDYVEFALTVIEAEEGRFHWILMEPVEGDVDDLLRYRPIDSSPEALPSYADAMLFGSSAMRARQNALREACRRSTRRTVNASPIWA